MNEGNQQLPDAALTDAHRVLDYTTRELVTTQAQLTAAQRELAALKGSHE